MTICVTACRSSRYASSIAKTEHQVRVRQTRQESRDRIIAAATELVRKRSYGELSVEEIMREAGFGRTIFYRHFDDLGDLLLRASVEAINELYQAERALRRAGPSLDPDVIVRAVELPVFAYYKHGPLLRAITEAAAGDERIAAEAGAVRQRFDDFIASGIRGSGRLSGLSDAEITETAHALGLMNEAYLLDAFGREPRISVETAVRTLTGIWRAVLEPAA
jgi:AcrR family transcriptional regulator